jgi:hypothetical protein
MSLFALWGYTFSFFSFGVECSSSFQRQIDGSYSVWRLLLAEEAPPFLNHENRIQTINPFDHVPTSLWLRVLQERVLGLFQPAQPVPEPEPQRVFPPWVLAWAALFCCSQSPQ